MIHALPPRPAASRITLAQVPPSFDGYDKAKWETFFDALTTYIGAYESEFDSERKRIYFTLSLLRAEDGSACPASNWARNWKRSHLRYGTLNLGETFEELVDELEKTFKDQNVKETAFLRLLGTRQGKIPLADFLQAFELNAEEAGYHPGNSIHDTFLCQTLEALISDEVRRQLYAGGIEIPGQYRDLKKRLMTINGILERGKVLKNQWASGGMFWTPAKTTTTVPAIGNKGNTPYQGTAPHLAKRIGPGETAPMDVDRARQNPRPFLCYNCGKAGHMKRECPEPPKKKFNIRSIRTDDYTQEDLQALATILREKGF